MVDKHPLRHDPSHIVTHRIQSTVVEFADCLRKAGFPHISNEQSTYLQMLNEMVMNHKNEALNFILNYLVIFVLLSS